MIVALLVLAVLGLILGSFVNAVVWRTRQQSLAKSRQSSAKNNQLSILYGRSQCTHCGHILASKDLIPVLSWLFLGGRCRYCQKPISRQYPLVELTMALVFLVSYLFWPSELHGAGQWVLFVTWLASAVGLLALAVYDWRWMILPSRILYPTLLAAFAGRLSYVLFFSDNTAHSFGRWALGVAVASGIFLLLYIVSQGRWIGFGDVRLGLITGTLLADPINAFLMIMLASTLGTLFVLPALLNGRRSTASKIPYGPFLIAASTIVMLFGADMTDWYRRIFLS